jgi:hypothetical protein
LRRGTSTAQEKRQDAKDAKTETLISWFFKKIKPWRPWRLGVFILDHSAKERLDYY